MYTVQNSQKDITLETYLIDLLLHYRVVLCKFRAGNHCFPVSTGRYQNVPYIECHCKICKGSDTGDSFFTCLYVLLLQTSEVCTY